MVEGPLLHRLACIHRKLLIGHAFTATSPTGRFADGAAAIDGHFLAHIEVHGKNMFYFFTPERVEEEGVLEKVGEDAVVVHIHLGMSGSFRTYQFPGPVPRKATRLRLYNEELGVEGHLSATLCDYGNIELYRKRILELGPDPLREDADKELPWASMQKTKRSIGAVLMDQSLVAGNWQHLQGRYEEILFVVGLHPDQPANTVSRAAFEFLWEQSVRQMEIGVQVGNIITILPEDAGKPLPSTKLSQLRYVYNQKACGKCGGVIKVWTIAQRSVYACETCQPPPPVTIPVSKRIVKKTMVDEDDDSKSAENGDDVDNDNGVIPERMPLRKRVAKGGRVVVHQGYKNEVPNSSPDDDKTSIQSRGVVNDSAPSEKPVERRSARLKQQGIAAVNQSSSTALGGFRGKLEFPPPRVARLSGQNFPTSSVRNTRGSLFICRSQDGSSSIKFPCGATSPVRLFTRPLGSTQPIVNVAAFGSILLGSMFLRGSIV